jgi:hypothetical protein
VEIEVRELGNVLLVAIDLCVDDLQAVRIGMIPYHAEYRIIVIMQDVVQQARRIILTANFLDIKRTKQ